MPLSVATCKNKKLNIKIIKDKTTFVEHIQWSNLLKWKNLGYNLEKCSINKKFLKCQYFYCHYINYTYNYLYASLLCRRGRLSPSSTILWKTYKNYKDASFSQNFQKLPIRTRFFYGVILNH